MIKFKHKPSKMDKRRALEFVIANARLEGHSLTLTEVKNVLKILNGKCTADELIERIITTKLKTESHL